MRRRRRRDGRRRRRKRVGRRDDVRGRVGGSHGYDNAAPEMRKPHNLGVRQRSDGARLKVGELGYESSEAEALVGDDAVTSVGSVHAGTTRDAERWQARTLAFDNTVVQRRSSRRDWGKTSTRRLSKPRIYRAAAEGGRAPGRGAGEPAVPRRRRGSVRAERRRGSGSVDPRRRRRSTGEGGDGRRGSRWSASESRSSWARSSSRRAGTSVAGMRTPRTRARRLGVRARGGDDDGDGDRDAGGSESRASPPGRRVFASLTEGDDGDGETWAEGRPRELRRRFERGTRTRRRDSPSVRARARAAGR